ncbi:MAG TPA: hypothetical protein VME45_19425 [Stellaceae bacterium]|nr:hypothetical protein [Stellaceae bacterium]
MALIDALPPLAFACLLYLGLMHDIVPSPAREFIQRGEPASNAIERGLAELVAFVLIFLLWIVLAILLFLGRKGQKMPPQALVAAAILLPLSGVAAIYATDLYASYAGWAIAVPALLPPLIALYAIWMRLPGLQATLPAKIINAAALGAMLVLTLAPFPLSAIDARIYAAGEPERQKQREAYLAANEAIAVQSGKQFLEDYNARFQALNADSPLRDVIGHLSGSEGSPDDQEVLAKARQVKSRQSDVVALLEEPTPGDAAMRGRDKIEWLEDMWRLDIAPTPAVCNAYGDALRREAENLHKYVQKYNNREDKADFAWASWALEVRDALARQLPNMKWLIHEHCDLGDALGVVETRVRDLCGLGLCTDADADGQKTRAFIDTLAALRRPQ